MVRCVKRPTCDGSNLISSSNRRQHLQPFTYASHACTAEQAFPGYCPFLTSAAVHQRFAQVCVDSPQRSTGYMPHVQYRVRCTTNMPKCAAPPALRKALRCVQARSAGMAHAA
jgi:hypothetical protein